MRGDRGSGTGESKRIANGSRLRLLATAELKGFSDRAAERERTHKDSAKPTKRCQARQTRRDGRGKSGAEEGRLVRADGRTVGVTSFSSWRRRRLPEQELPLVLRLGRGQETGTRLWKQRASPCHVETGSGVQLCWDVCGQEGAWHLW
eukprot:SAG31_NODE_1701_length_7496_cov_248.949169_4_plen_148_part_00